GADRGAVVELRPPVAGLEEGGKRFGQTVVGPAWDRVESHGCESEAWGLRRSARARGGEEQHEARGGGREVMARPRPGVGVNGARGVPLVRDRPPHSTWVFLQGRLGSPEVLLRDEAWRGKGCPCPISETSTRGGTTVAAPSTRMDG